MNLTPLTYKPWVYRYNGIKVSRASINLYTTQPNLIRLGLYEELDSRQLIAQVTSDKLKTFLSTGSRTVYCGFDPTAPSLHLGHLFSLVTLLRFRQFGHRTIALIGGATGAIGDPSGRNTERPVIDAPTLATNQTELQVQVSKFFERAASQLSLDQPPTLILNNLEWFEKMSALEFLSNPGRYARLSIMLAKDCVKNRLESPQGIAFSEFSYQLFQAYDFWYLHQNYGCQLQVGGQDQWGNIVAGIELIHKRRTNSAEAFGLTTPLLTNACGEKLGKTLTNGPWLDPRLTSPFQFYQHFMKTPDAGLERQFKSFTFLKPETINDIIAAHYRTPEALEGQRKLAQHVTRLVHGDDGLASAEALTDTLYNSDQVKLQGMSASDLDLAFSPERSPKDLVTSLPMGRLLNQPLTSVVVASGLTKSEAEAARLIRLNGLSLNHRRVDPNASATSLVKREDLIGGAWGLILRAGKANYRVVRAV